MGYTVPMMTTKKDHKIIDDILLNILHRKTTTSRLLQSFIDLEAFKSIMKVQCLNSNDTVPGKKDLYITKLQYNSYSEVLDMDRFELLDT